MIGSVTLANMRLSIVDGNAFVDFSSDVFGDHIGDKLIVYDSAGKKAIGYIKAAGTGETLDNELVTNGDFDPDEGWTKGVWSIADGKAAATASSYSFLYQNADLAGKLIKSSVDIDSISGGPIKVCYHGTANGGTARTTTGTHAEYYTPSSSGTATIGAQTQVNVTCSIDNLSMKQVLTPSATGVTITSTPGGTTYNWASVESGFNYNDPSGYTYSIVASRDILYEDNDILVMDIKDAPTTNGTSTIIYASDFNCKKLSIENIRHSIYGVKLVLSFDATTDDKCLIITGNDTIDIGNPILNPMSAGYTGDIVLTTLGVTEDSTYNLIIKLRKY